MNPWVMIIAQYGLPFALKLAKILADKREPTAEDFEALIKEFGTETLAEKLAKSRLKLGLPPA